MKKQSLIFLGFIFILFWGCATPGQKFIDITYLADHEKKQTGGIGIAPFQDNRTDMGEGYIGYRILLDNSQETYLVKGLNLADTLTRIIGIYFEKNGFTTTPIDPWDLTPDGVMKASKGFKHILAGTINRFECRAKKKGGVTDMILDIDLTLYLGITDKNVLKTIPVSFTLERTELVFTREKLEQFVNPALKEVIQKALVF
ncbi:MAG: hypothetical protein K8S13_02845 [Desulfobacula sp.]|uniref:hypothetical protein n=1 Tax=Desulfobacula sp. TaxID=2593537 RepID=UPI0025B9F3CE|nr:hypothetical protein [Desulfobacula sp.]MCD4718782.1 hypothetical protein [Desulfobacula sp.]